MSLTMALFFRCGLSKSGQQIGSNKKSGQLWAKQQPVAVTLFILMSFIFIFQFFSVAKQLV